MDQTQGTGAMFSWLYEKVYYVQRIWKFIFPVISATMLLVRKSCLCNNDKDDNNQKKIELKRQLTKIKGDQLT